MPSNKNAFTSVVPPVALDARFVAAWDEAMDSNGKKS